MSYIVVQDWMCNELGLKGNELLVYALIHGFSQDGESAFRGSRRYVANLLNISLPTVDSALNKLIEKDLIIKEVVVINSVRFSTYKAKIGSKETLQGVKENEEKNFTGSKETLPNNIVTYYTNNKLLDNKSNNKSSINTTVAQAKKKKKSLWDKCIELIDSFTEDSKVKDALIEFVRLQLEIYRSQGRPYYATILHNRLKKLQTEFKPDEYLEVISWATSHGWQNFYKPNKVSQSKYHDTANSVDYTEEEIEELRKYGTKF